MPNKAPKAIRDNLDDYGPSSWRETRNFWPDDELLRDQMPPFKILRRPKSGRDIWTRFGKEFTLAEALALAKGEPAD